MATKKLQLNKLSLYSILQNECCMVYTFQNISVFDIGAAA